MPDLNHVHDSNKYRNHHDKRPQNGQPKYGYLLIKSNNDRDNYKVLTHSDPQNFDDFSSYYFDSVFEYLVVFSDI